MLSKLLVLLKWPHLNMWSEQSVICKLLMGYETHCQENVSWLTLRVRAGAAISAAPRTPSHPFTVQTTDCSRCADTQHSVLSHQSHCPDSWPDWRTADPAPPPPASCSGQRGVRGRASRSFSLSPVLGHTVHGTLLFSDASKSDPKMHFSFDRCWLYTNVWNIRLSLTPHFSLFHLKEP